MIYPYFELCFSKIEFLHTPQAGQSYEGLFSASSPRLRPMAFQATLSESLPRNSPLSAREFQTRLACEGQHNLTSKG